MISFKFTNLILAPSVPSAKLSRSASVTSQQPEPIEHATSNPETLEVPEQPVQEPSDEEAPPAPPPPRGKRGGAPRKNVRKNASPSVLDDAEGMPPTLIICHQFLKIKLTLPISRCAGPCFWTRQATKSILIIKKRRSLNQHQACGWP